MSPDHPPIRTFGRRRFRTLRPNLRARLDTNAQGICYSPEQGWEELLVWAKRYSVVVFDIGFGNGQELFAQCQSSPDTAFVGFEPFEAGVARLLAAAEDAHLDNLRIIPEPFDIASAQELRKLSVSAVRILNPDPWPKARHHKRRLIQVGFMHGLASILSSDATVVISTDHAGYADHIGMVSARIGDDWHGRLSTTPPTADWQPTKYERRGISEGRPMQYFIFGRV